MEDFIRELRIENPVPLVGLNNASGFDQGRRCGFKECIPIAIKAYIEYMDKPCGDHWYVDNSLYCGSAVDNRVNKHTHPEHRRDCPLCQARVHEVFGCAPQK
jgi:hypothetical protein